MSIPWPKAKLGEILKRVERFESRDELMEYPFAGTYSYARGIFVGECKLGSTFALPKIQRIRAGDFIYCKIMAWEGAFGIAPEATNNCVMSGAFVVYELNRERIDEKFLDFFFKVPAHWQNIGSQSTGTNVRRQSLHPKQFESAEIPLPPLVEQRRVVAQIEELAAQINEACTLRQQAAEEASFLIPSGMAEIFRNLGQKHPTQKLESLCDVVRGGSPRPAGSSLYYGGKIPFMKVGDLTKDDGMYLYEASASVNELGREHSRFIEADTLMLTNSGATLGVPKITKISGCFNDGSQAFLNVKSLVKKEYLYYLFKSKTLWFREQLARGQGQPNLNTDMTKHLDVPIPPLNEQVKIISELDALQTEVNILNRQQAETAAELDALLPAILDRAFKGEL